MQLEGLRHSLSLSYFLERALLGSLKEASFGAICPRSRNYKGQAMKKTLNLQKREAFY